MQKFSPHLEILPPAQRELWRELDQVPAEFTLYGGTAIALHLGHRQSVDFDFFGIREFDNREDQVSVSFFGVTTSAAPLCTARERRQRPEDRVLARSRRHQGVSRAG